MIKAVLFDMGGTLEDISHSEDSRIQNGKNILEYLSRHGIVLAVNPESFGEQLFINNKSYKEFSDLHQVELPPYEIWKNYRLKDYSIDDDKLRALSERLSHIWELSFYGRKLRANGKEILAALQQRGYALGIISNTPSLVQVHYTLREYGIIDYFSYIGLSSLHGFKKPNKLLFDIGAADMGFKNSECAYIGDTISRDVNGARGAGYGLCVRIDSYLTQNSDRNLTENATDADFVITDLLEICSILDSDRRDNHE